MRTLLLGLALALVASSPAFAFAKGVPTVQGATNGTPIPVAQAENGTTGTIAATGDTVVLPLVGSPSSFYADVRGTWTGTLQVEKSIDGFATWTVTFFLDANQVFITNAQITAIGTYVGNAAGATSLRLRATSWTSGTATVTLRATNAVAGVYLQNSLRLIDSGSGSNAQLSIKAGSTPPATGDTAVVVAQSPNAAPICDSSINFSQTANAQLVTAAAGQKVYICGIVLVSATAQSVSLVEGTGTTCATGIAGLIGGSSASMALSANGGFSSVSGSPWISTKTAGDELCLLQSGTGNVSGTISYRVQ